MREFKFRAWDKENNFMFYYGYNYPLSKYYLGFNYKNHNKMSLMILVDPSDNEFREIEADIMQGTGLKDDNGKEIYEGDIVKVKERMAGEDLIGKVIYDKTKGCYWITQGDEKSWFKTTFNLEDYEHYVIGNIYENKELLEE